MYDYVYLNIPSFFLKFNNEKNASKRIKLTNQNKIIVLSFILFTHIVIYLYYITFCNFISVDYKPHNKKHAKLTMQMRKERNSRPAVNLFQWFRLKIILQS